MVKTAISVTITIMRSSCCCSAASAAARSRKRRITVSPHTQVWGWARASGGLLPSATTAGGRRDKGPSKEAGASAVFRERLLAVRSRGSSSKFSTGGEDCSSGGEVGGGGERGGGIWNSLRTSRGDFSSDEAFKTGGEVGSGGDCQWFGWSWGTCWSSRLGRKGRASAEGLDMLVAAGKLGRGEARRVRWAGLKRVERALEKARHAPVACCCMSLSNLCVSA